METAGAAAATPAAKADEDDFFESWSKPATPKSSAPSTPRVSTPPVIGRAASPAVASQPAAARPVASSAARPSKLGASRLNSASSTSSSGPKKSKLGLGAAKAKPVDFEAAERKALEEAERIKQLGYDRQREEEEEKARKEAAAKKMMMMTDEGLFTFTSHRRSDTTYLIEQDSL